MDSPITQAQYDLFMPDAVNDLSKIDYTSSANAIETVKPDTNMMSQKNSLSNYEDYVSILSPMIELHTPNGSNPKAVLDQWLHAIKYDSELYCDKMISNSDELKKLVLATLRNNELSLFDANNQRGTFTFIDLFAGIGGIRTGAERNNGVCVFSSEFDKFA